MRAIILAAGRGSRIKKFTNFKPKAFIKIDNKTLLEHQLEIYLKSGIEKIAIVTGYKNKLFNKYNLKKFNNDKWKSTNMVFSLTKAKSWLKSFNCIVSYSDILFDKKIILDLLKSKTQLELPYNLNWKKNWKLRYKRPLEDLETFKISKNNYVMEIGKKPKKYKDIEGQFMGIIKFTPKSWKKVNNYLNKIKSRNKNMQMTKLIDNLISNNVLKVKGTPSKSQWFEIDNLNDYRVAKKFYKFD